MVLSSRLGVVPSCLDPRRHFPLFGKTARGAFGEEELSLHGHLENTAVATHQLGASPETVRQLGRQPGGPGAVVSLAAVEDLDLHPGLHGGSGTRIG